MENRKYYCDCEQTCHGVRREVGKSTYYRHGPYRDPLSRYTPDMRSFLKNIPIITHALSSSAAPSSRVRVDGPSDENTDHTMSSPLTPFQGMQQRNVTSLTGLYNATPSLLEDVTPTSTTFGSGLSTPFDEHSLLSPLDIAPPINNTLRTSNSSLRHETSAYNQLMQQNILLRNELRKEKEAHNMLR